ncbi:MAG: hypothetical protein ABGY11_06730 [Candidatus Thioglobus sp.]|jgi:VIT1/CCC1 family predicted Fe2+/Mn2+ transporter
MKTLANKPKEVTLLIKFLYLEAILALLGVYDEYNPETESMYIFLGIFIAFGLMSVNTIKDFSKGGEDAYNTIKFGSYIITAMFFIITFLLVNESISEYLKTHPYFIAFPLAGILNIMWLNSKAVKDWFAKQ